jgi:alanyl-tRNA synthetase
MAWMSTSSRLYYDDPYLREFDATVAERTTYAGKPAVTLDRTAFYPTSGGQPFDVGTLGGARVVDVVDTEDGRVLHVLDRLPDTGTVRGVIDWTRRFDHMQQHTGQHVLSAAFDRLIGARTESFHLGADYSTIDLGRELSPVDVARAEAEANRIVWEDRPVAIRYATADEAATMGLRKESKREGTLRLVDVEDFELSACGGTHVARTGAIGIIAISATERFRGGLRVTFLCGGRALTGFRALRDAVAGSVRALSVLPAELPAAIERLQAEGKEQRRLLKDLQGQLAAHEADALAADAIGGGAVRIVLASLPGWDSAVLKTIASRIAERPGHVAVLVGDPPASPIVIARAGDASVDAGAVLKALVARHGGRGGGRPELAQGGGITSPAAEVLRSAREILLT